MEQDLKQAEQADQEDDDEVVVVTPVLPKPPVIDLTDEDDDVYHNVTIRITSGGGFCTSNGMSKREKRTKMKK